MASLAVGMEREGEQVERHQDPGEGFLAVPEVVFEIVSVGLEHVEGFVLDLPPRASTGGEFGDSARVDRQIGDEAVVVCPLALAFRISMENQLTISASSVARIGTPESHR